MPDWDGLGRIAADGIDGYEHSNALESISSYAHVHSRLHLVELLSRELHISSSQPGRVHEEFCRLPFPRVVTTNFDFLLEQAYSRVGKYCLPLVLEDQLAMASTESGVKLLKFHGDIHHPARMVVTEEDYDGFLTECPLLATHLSNLLIDHSGLFIGYSLDDPDFRQLFNIIKSRLGCLRRPAYVLQMGAAPHAVAKYERRGVKVINLPKRKGVSYADVLSATFGELREFWGGEVLKNSAADSSETQADLTLPADAQSRMVYFAVPAHDAAYYREYVYPVVEKYGLTPVMEYDVIAPGDSELAKIEALINRSVLVFLDVASSRVFRPDTMYLYGANLSKIVLIVADAVRARSILDGVRVIVRPGELFQAKTDFLEQVEEAVSSVSKDLSLTFAIESRRLLAKGEYRAAVISAFAIFEHELNVLMERLMRLPSFVRGRLVRMVELAKGQGFLQAIELVELMQAWNLRNVLVHSQASVSKAEAEKVVSQLEMYTQLVKSEAERAGRAGQ